MNHRRQTDLLRQQQQLLLRSAELRGALQQQVQALRTPLALADQLQAGLHWLGRHPVWPLAALAWLLLRPPHRLLRWLPTLLSAWQLMQQLGAWLDRPARPAP